MLMRRGEKYRRSEDKILRPNEPPTRTDWFEDGKDHSKLMKCYHTEPLGKILALLGTNRQIFREAMPVFYNINHFHAVGVEEAVRMLQHCGPERRKHFKSISFGLQTQVSWADTKHCVELLMEVKDIHTLLIKTTKPGCTQ
jgi:hypothetical protein